MREIKFRAKADYDKQWHYGSYVYTNNDSNNPFGTTPITHNHRIVEYFPADWNLGGWETIDIDRDTLGQFTGLKDKNGKDIYEGDILSFAWFSDEPIKEDMLEVRFVRGVFAFLWNGDLDDECITNAPTHEWATVVGNIYDNPELITDKNKQ